MALDSNFNFSATMVTTAILAVHHYRRHHRAKYTMPAEANWSVSFRRHGL